MSPACWCGKGSLPLALMKSASTLRPITVPRLHQRRHFTGLPSHSRSITSPRCHPSTSLRRCRRNSERYAPDHADPALDHWLRRGAGPARPGVPSKPMVAERPNRPTQSRMRRSRTGGARAEGVLDGGGRFGPPPLARFSCRGSPLGRHERLCASSPPHARARTGRSS
jgi:hypothetical protein